jgi:hypothetical protein
MNANTRIELSEPVFNENSFPYIFTNIFTNGTLIVAYLLCALSASGAISLILEMDTPLDGIVKIPIALMRDALARLGS